MNSSTKKNLNQIYKHLLISFILAIIYFTSTFLALNGINNIYMQIVLLILQIILIALIWYTYAPNSKFASVIFILFVTILFYSNFVYNKSIQEKTNFFELSTSDSINRPDLISKLNYLNRLKQSNTNYRNDIHKLLRRNLIFNHPIRDYNIFFVETNIEQKHFSSKQLCAIESAAAHNPNANVFVISFTAEMTNQTKLMGRYPNIILLKLTPFEIFSDTPLLKWWNSGKVNLSPFKTAHISDACRIALLWKYGGFYSDLDTIAVKNFEPLMQHSGAGYLNGKHPSLGNGFLHFRASHPFLKLVIEQFAKDYNPNIWGYNGPILFRRMMSKYCNVTDIYSSLLLKQDNLLINDQNQIHFDNYTNISENSTNDLSNGSSIDSSSLSSVKHSNCDVVVYPQEFFYPYNNYQLSYLFNKKAQLNVSAFINTYSVHFYGKLSSKFKVSSKDNSAFEYFASGNCEQTYRNVKSGFSSF